MLSEIGSIASIVGLPLSLIALVVAIYHLLRLRGETRAAREAAEEALSLYRSHLANTDLARLRERIQRLIELHRQGDVSRALDQYREIWEMFLSIRLRLPNLPGKLREEIQRAVEEITDMQSQVEAIDSDAMSPALRQAFNDKLLKMQTNLLSNLEEAIEVSRPAR